MEKKQIEYLEGIICPNPNCGLKNRLLTEDNKGWYRPKMSIWECSCGAHGKVSMLGSKVLALELSEVLEKREEPEIKEPEIKPVEEGKPEASKVVEFKKKVFIIKKKV